MPTTTVASRSSSCRTAGRRPPAATAAAVADWWQTNADVIGPDPDLLLPGQVLQAPPPSSEELR
ncbi:hypothetical protein A7K94_0218960 [Modestobacter sp. VKM Ac-2676]|nr:hypothetical protein A7K94_0218960 [Modestobacter sp. VKM Ac-2676]